MFARIAGGIDPLVRLLVLAILLASFLPVTGVYRPIAQAVSNGAISSSMRPASILE